MPQCVFCDDEIVVTNNRHYQRVIGWERQRSAGGTNHIVLRTPIEVYACVECVDKLKSGISIGQQSLM